MTTIKSFTDIEKSRKLAKILPLESADMFWKNGVSDKYIQCFTPFVMDDTNMDYDYDVPCWSLAPLLNYLKSKNKFPEIKELSDGRFKLTTYIWDGKDCIQFSIGDFLVDACVEMIIKLKELNLL